MISKAEVALRFEKSFSAQADIFSFAPGRVNLIGEHVDYLGGRVVPAAIDRGVTFAGRVRPGERLVVVAADRNEREVWTAASLQGTAPDGWRAYVWGVLVELAKLGHPWQGGELIFCGDVPAGSGLSSSAALEVAAALFFLKCAGRELPLRDLALLGQRVEHLHVGTKCGIMDQYASVHGRPGHFMVLDCQTLACTQHPASLPDCAWVLVNSMVSHKLGADYNHIRAVLESAEQKLGGGPLVRLGEGAVEAAKDRLSAEEFAKALYATGEQRRSGEFVEALGRSDAVKAGVLLQETHFGLSKQLGVSTDELDELISASQGQPGWFGGRMMGGGFGGCTIHLLDRRCVDDFRAVIAARFKARFGLVPEFYPVELGMGAVLL